MKIKAIAALCKSKKWIQIHEGKTIQYIGDGSALYPLYKMPRLTDETVMTIFDIPEDKKVDFVCKVEELPESINMADIMEGEQHIEDVGMRISYQGYTLIPLKCSTGLIFIDQDYMKPITEKYIEFYERETKEGTLYIALKAGMLIHGAVMPLQIITKDFVDAMRDMTEEMEAAMNNIKFEKTKGE